ncbi:MAG: sulfotransferase [Microthrixaceae bacterium]
MSSPVPVLYVGGTGRTGSTVLDRMLGNVPGVFAAGEVTWLWFALRGGGRCACGERHPACPVWGPVLEATFGERMASASGVREVADEMFSLRRRFDSRYLPLMAVPGLGSRLARRLGAYPERLAAMYRNLAAHTGAQLIVDSSKEPHYSSILAAQPQLDVRFLHLVRHPMATAYSWGRRRTELGFGAGHDMERRGPISAAVYYDVSNLAADALWGGGERYLRVRYEDLVSRPESTLERIGGFAGVDVDVDVALGRASVARPGTVANADGVPSGHAAWGNPNRFATGPVTLRNDDEWTRSASPALRRWTSLLAGPVAGRYGY